MNRAVMANTAAVLVAAVLVAPSGGVSAQERKLLGTNGEWVAFESETSKGKICYIISQPQDKEPKNVRRDEVYFMVSHRPGDNVKNEVMTVIGYPFDKKTDASAEIGDAKWAMFTNGDSAWVELPSTEEKIVDAMKSGTTMVVHGTSWRGTQTTDQYSLSGVTASLKLIDDACQ